MSYTSHSQFGEYGSRFSIRFVFVPKPSLHPILGVFSGSIEAVMNQCRSRGSRVQKTWTHCYVFERGVDCPPSGRAKLGCAIQGSGFYQKMRRTFGKAALGLLDCSAERRLSREMCWPCNQEFAVLFVMRLVMVDHDQCHRGTENRSLYCSLPDH